MSNYITRIATNLDLEGYEVGLSEISYTKSWFNINEKQIFGLLDANGIMHSNPVGIAPGRYDNQDEFIAIINHCLKTYHTDLIPVPPRLELNKFSRRITMIAGKDINNVSCYAVLPLELQNMLGFSEQFYKRRFGYGTGTNLDGVELDLHQNSIKGEKNAFNSYDLNAGIHSLYVYCDIVEPSFVGDTYAQLLRVVEIPSTIPFGEQCIIKYEKPHYFSLNTRNFQTIEIDIKDDSGEPIKFQFGRTRIVLHFRKEDGSLQ